MRLRVRDVRIVGITLTRRSTLPRVQLPLGLAVRRIAKELVHLITVPTGVLIRKEVRYRDIGSPTLCNWET